MLRSYSTSPSTRPAAAFLVLAALCVPIYATGLDGGFLFDDWVNLPALGRYGPVEDLDALLRYVTSGGADPTGRPVSMLSFLIDARNWPADPAPFKRTNIILHILNGILLYHVLTALGERVAHNPKHAHVAAILAAGIWLLHPLWVSTVLYIVQRHAMLAAFFVLGGLRLWIASDKAFREGQPLAGWWLGMASVGGCGLLAGLSKANGFLLPALLLTLNLSVLRIQDGTLCEPNLASLRRARLVLVNIPSLLVFLGLAVLAFTAQYNFQERPWTVGERLLTQPRVICEYLYYLLVPGIDARGIFADDYRASMGLFAPPVTALAILTLAGLVALAWRQRLHGPAFAAAILFFLGGHAMESGALKLELYFEHRNYLPAAMLFWPLALTLTRPARYRRLGLFAAAGLLVVCAACTLIQAKLWGDPERLAMTWAMDIPDSPRAQANAASFEIRGGRADHAIARLSPLVAAFPDEPQVALNLLTAHCAAGNPEAAIQSAKRAISVHGVRQHLVYQWLTDTLSGDGNCRILDNPTLHELLLAAEQAMAGPAPAPEHRARVHRLRGLYALRDKNCPAALNHFNTNLDVHRRAEYAQTQIGLLATHCGPEAGLGHLHHYLSGAHRGDAPMTRPILRLRDWIIARQGLWEDEWKRLESLLLDDLGSAGAEAETAGPGSALPSTEQQRSDTASCCKQQVGDHSQHPQNGR